MIFWAPAAVALLTTARAITRANPVHALLWFVVSLLAMAIIFFGLGAAFAAALEVIVYAGAIVVLFLFVVMMLSLDRTARLREKISTPPRAWIIPILFVGCFGTAIAFVIFRTNLPFMPGQPVPPPAVAQRLFGTDLPAIELASMLLLAGLIAAFHLGREAEK